MTRLEYGAISHNSGENRNPMDRDSGGLNIMKHALSAPHVTLSEVEGSGSEGGGASQCDAREILRFAQNDITWSERRSLVGTPHSLVIPDPDQGITGGAVRTRSGLAAAVVPYSDKSGTIRTRSLSARRSSASFVPSTRPRRSIRSGRATRSPSRGPAASAAHS